MQDHDYTIEVVDGVVEITLLENMSYDGLRGLMGEVSKTYSEYRLWDFSAGIQLDPDSARALGEFGKSVTARQSVGWVAIVAPSDVTFGMARMETAYRDDGKIQQRVFRSKAEARAWLDSHRGRARASTPGAGLPGGDERR